MDMHTFSLKAAHVVSRIEDSPIGAIFDKVKPAWAHVVGMTSGGGGLALASKWAVNLQPIAAFIATVIAIVGSFFYAVYWLYKMLRERKAYKTGKGIKSDTDTKNPPPVASK